MIAAIAFQEDRADEARRLLGGRTLNAPTLLQYELCSISEKKTARHPELAERIRAGLDSATRLEVTLHLPDLHRVLECALQQRLSAYDAAYLDLAWRLEIPLITFDARLAAAAKSPPR